MVTPNSLAWQTCAKSFLSIFILFSVVFLKLSSCAKLIVISFDFSELILMSFWSVDLAETSCITDTSFPTHMLYMYSRLHNYTIEQSF